jgi:hypothetical protein
MDEVRLGQRWKDRDQRIKPPRFVLVCELEDGFVYYTTEGRANPPKIRSRVGRFVRAFKLAELWDR